MRFTAANFARPSVCSRCSSRSRAAPAAGTCPAKCWCRQIFRSIRFTLRSLPTISTASRRRCLPSAKHSHCHRSRIWRCCWPRPDRPNRCRHFSPRRRSAAGSSPRRLVRAKCILRPPRRCRAGQDWNARRCSCKAAIAVRFRHSCRDGARSSSGWQSAKCGGRSMSIRWGSAEAHAQVRDCPGVIIRSLLPRNAALTQLKTELSAMVAEGIARVAPGATPPAIALERPKQAKHGDYSTNAALQLAKALKRNPRELAADLVAALPRSPLLARAEVAGAGFVNLYVSDAARQSVVARILDEGDRYGSSARGGGEKVIVEFVSANPTGPLHVGHGRGAAVGDAIARLLAAQGFAVHREFYYNDAGAQIMNLALNGKALGGEQA